MNYYEVAPTKIFRAGADRLTYTSPKILLPGTLILIPLGKTIIPGLLIRPVPQPTFPCKPITKILYDQPLPIHLINSLLWLSTYYATPLPTVLQTALPRGIAKTRREKPRSQPARSNFDTHEQTRDPKEHPTYSVASTPSIPLNPAQKTILDQFQSNKTNTTLLHGITGSGKTNIYLELTRQTLAKSQSVILLVPEIALTSQLVANFQQHFDQITLLHSKQTESERHLLWQKILKTETPQIIIGPRSALFAPVRNLGLIIIDEAHDQAYHQDQSPKYSALRLASTMSRTLLGTATPTITDYYLCNQKNAVLELTELAIKSKKTAKIQVLDLKNRTNFKKHRLFSDQLLTSIENSLSQETQSLIFHNRRGSAPLTLCQQCGWQALCPHCLLPLTLHTDHFSLLCHTCGFKQKIPTACPTCKNAEIIHKGFGTKLIESELQKLFPTAKLARFDADNTELDSKTLYNYIQDHKPDIIIGTQIISKGLDLKNLTTLGVVQADAGLALPDFSSEERTFQLLTQVIGRATRGHQNTEIFIQTYQPDHPAIHFGTKSDYQNFYHHLLAQRKKSHLPPFTFLLKLSLTYKTESATIKNITNLREEISKLSFLHTRANSGSEVPAITNLPISISQATPSFHEHTPQGYTWQLLVKSPSRTTLLQIIKNLPSNPHLHLILDPPTLL